MRLYAESTPGSCPCLISTDSKVNVHKCELFRTYAANIRISAKLSALMRAFFRTYANITCIYAKICA
jgi:hypothetical protein